MLKLVDLLIFSSNVEMMTNLRSFGPVETSGNVYIGAPAAGQLALGYVAADCGIPVQPGPGLLAGHGRRTQGRHHQNHKDLHHALSISTIPQWTTTPLLAESDHLASFYTLLYLP